MKSMDNKVALVTGGNSGIGLAIARELHGRGARIVIIGRDEQTLESARSQLGDDALAFAGDVRNREDLERIYARTRELAGPVDYLVANAGVAIPRPLENVDEEFFDLHFDVNVKGLYFTVQQAIPHLGEGASILLITSGTNTRGFEGFSVYAATKAAVRSLARSFSTELIGRGIRVNALSPGPVETPLFGRMGLSEEQLQGMAEGFSAAVPVKRFARAEEMATAAAFLLSEESSYVVGAELVADGGLNQL